MNGFLHDVRCGFRILLKTPIVSIVAIVTLALGIGVTTAIFTFVDAGLLRTLNFPNPDQLVQITMAKHGESTGNQAGPGSIGVISARSASARARSTFRFKKFLRSFLPT